MILIAILTGFVFESQYFTNFHNAMSYAIWNDTCYVATTGGIVYFPINEVNVENSILNFKYDIFTASNGLESNYVRDLCFDDQGNMWAVVQDFGLHVKRKNSTFFEGYELPLITLRKTRFLTFFPPDYLLLGTNYGLFVVNTRGNLSPEDDAIYPPLLIRDTIRYIFKGTNFAYVVTPGRVYGWSPDSVFILNLPVDYGSFGPLVEFNGQLVYSTGNRLVCADSDTVLVFTLSNIYHMAVSGDSVFIASLGGTYKLVGRTLSRILSDMSSLAIPLKDIVIATSFRITRENSFYGPPWKFIFGSRTYQFRSPIPFNLITSLKAKNGLVCAGVLLWVGDTASLPSKVMILKNDTAFIAESLETAAHAVRTLDIDDSGRVWVGMFSDNSPGIYIFDSQGKFHSRISNLPSNIISHISINRDTIVAIWQRGIYRIHKINGEFQSEEIFRIDYPFFVVSDSKDEYLIGTENEGLVKVNATGTVLLRLNPSELNSSLVSVARERSGKIYIGATSGLFVYENQQLKKVREGNVRDIEFYKGYTIVFQDSSILLLSKDSVISVFDYVNSPFIPVDEDYYYVRDVLEVIDDGSIYAGGEQGILYMKFLYPEISRKSFRIFPNPCTKGDRLYVETSEAPTVYNLAMQRMPFKAYRDGSLFYFETADWDKGLYIVVVEGKEPQRIFIK